VTEGTHELAASLATLVEEQLGVTVLAQEPIKAGLGLRRFVRLSLDGPPGRLVARIEAPEDPAGRPPGLPPEPSLEPLRRRLEEAGLPVPSRYGGDPRRGIDLLEDLGDLTLERALAVASPAERRALYQEACGLVPRLQRLDDPRGELRAFRRRLDRSLFDYKADLFARHSLPRALGRPAREPERRAVRRAFAWIADYMAQAPERLAHRDFQSQNLLVHPAGGGAGARLVMIDLQGAFLAPPEYDLVCLLRDSYVELPDAEVQAHLERVRPALPDAPAPDTFARRFDLLTLTRKGKDHARYLYAVETRGDARFGAYVPAAARALRSAAARVRSLDPCLARLADWIALLPEEAPACAP